MKKGDLITYKLQDPTFINKVFKIYTDMGDTWIAVQVGHANNHVCVNTEDDWVVVGNESVLSREEFVQEVISAMASEHGTSNEMFLSYRFLIERAYDAGEHATEEEITDLCCGPNEIESPITAALVQKFPLLTRVFESVFLEPPTLRQFLAQSMPWQSHDYEGSEKMQRASIEYVKTPEEERLEEFAPKGPIVVRIVTWEFRNSWCITDVKEQEIQVPELPPLMCDRAFYFTEALSAVVRDVISTGVVHPYSVSNTLMPSDLFNFTPLKLKVQHKDGFIGALLMKSRLGKFFL